MSEEPLVYFIQGQTTKLVKIGHTSRLDFRLAYLQAGSPDVLKVLRTILGTVDDAAYHNKFRIDWVRGEWFRASANLMAFINRLPVSPYDGRIAPRASNRGVNSIVLKSEWEAAQGAYVLQSSPSR